MPKSGSKKTDTRQNVLKKHICPYPNCGHSTYNIATHTAHVLGCKNKQ